MSTLTKRIAILSCGAFTLIAVIGWSRQSDPLPTGPHSVESGSPDDVELPTDAPSEAFAGSEMAQDLASGRLPLQFPSASDGAADDVAEEGGAESGSGLLNVLRETVDLSPIFEATGIQEGLSDGLAAAQDELTRRKRDNRAAIRHANRQVRVGQAAASPDLLLISVDGLGYGDLGCYGQTGYETPNVDRLARRGLRFTDFYAGSARSRASRWCLMTGHNTGRATIPPAGEERFTLPENSGGNVLPDMLWDAGYTTGLVGVWDERANPLDFGYDQWSGFPAAAGEFNSYPDVVYLDGARARLPANSNGGRAVHAGELLLQEGLAFLDRHANDARPCFLHLALPSFDSPLNADTGAPSAVAELDRIVGALLDWLDERELADRTCVMLMGASAPGIDEADGFDRTGDLNVHSSGLSEGNLRVPLIVAWEGRIAAGETAGHVCAIWDALPTLADLAFAMRRPQRLDGLSFAGTLLGRSQSEHRLLYWETREHGFGQAVRMGDWKGVRLPRQASLALFDLTTDPGERHDLSSERPEVVDQLIVRD